jgi:uncharacterized repeat protein (TIGR01451 family)
MRNKVGFFLLIFILSLGLTLAWVLGAQTSSGVAAFPMAELRVCPSGCAYDNVQDAVDAATEGDIIKVAEGIYTGVSAREGYSQTVYLSKTLTIRGGYTTSNWSTPSPEVNITTLDALGMGRVIFITQTVEVMIDGLHITGGDASGQSGGPHGWDAGGGLQCWGASIKITNNHIFGNTAPSSGGGMYTGFCSGDFIGNTFNNNITSGGGGGLLIHASGSGLVNISGNIFEFNNAKQGGGLYVDNSSARLYRNTFSQNTAIFGGGLFLYLGGPIGTVSLLNQNMIISNTADHGGGILITNDEGPGGVTLINTVIADNQASVEGSGVYISTAPSVHMLHTTLTNNIGGDGCGVCIGELSLFPWQVPGPSTVTLTNTILTDQSIGLGVTGGSMVNINSILWHSDPITVSQSLTATVVVQNQLTGDPVFTDPANSDYHITGASAARDVGVDAGVTSDLDGRVRKMGFGFDPGAYEYPDAALSLYKTPELSGANVGEELIYTIIMTSSGVLHASNVVLTDTLDTWQRATAVDSVDGNCIIDDSDWGGAVVCNPADMHIGDVIEIALTAQVSQSTPIGQAMINTLSTLATETDNSLQTQPVYAQGCYVRIGDNPKMYTSVQEAVDAAYPTALVKVAGTCTGVYGPEGWRQQVFIDRPLSLQGGYTASNWTTPDPEANITTLDARGQGRVLYIYEEDWTQWMDVQIDGLHITGGSSDGQSNHDPFFDIENSGGGVYVYGADPTFSNDHIFGNTSPGNGGGVFGSFAFLSFRDTSITDNTALGDGGGVALHAEGSEFNDTRFEGNSAENGGGFASSVYGGGQFTRSTFIGNHANGFGGGLALEVNAWVNETLILSNMAERGAGIGFFETYPPWSTFATLTNNVIANNQATLEGTGIFIPSGIEVHMLHNTLARNTGGDGSGVTLGWYDWMPPGTSTLLMTDTVLSYQDVGLNVGDASNVTVNGILWFANSDNVLQSDDATVVLTNELPGDPVFLNPDFGDYHIGEASAARDKGVPSGVTVDIDGEPRPMGIGWDLGADEFFLNSTYIPMTTRN